MLVKRNETKTRIGIVETPEKQQQRRNKEFNLNEFYQKENSCLLADLKELERSITADFAANSTRILLVSPDRRRRLDPVDDDDLVRLPSRSLSIYSMNSSENDTINQTNPTKSCSICINGVWTSSEAVCRVLYSPNLEFCRREELPDKPDSILLDDDNEAPDSQDLFEPGSVKVVYRLSETTSVCRACLSDGRWSKFSQSSLCDSKEAFLKPNLSSNDEFENRISCRLSELEEGRALILDFI